MPVNRYFSSAAQPTTLSGSISAGATTLTVGATTGFPTGFPYTLAVDYGAATEELVDVTAAATTTLTVTRGVDGTSAQSHSLGAVVRHVASGRDFADYQTHQAATSAIHGVAGTIVGTTDVQTLTNKTLTSPVLNTPTTTNPTVTGGSLAGTFTGTPTWSGAAIFTGAPFFQGAAAGNTALNARVAADTNPRLLVQADGKLIWGSGSGAGDAVLYRELADVLTTDDQLRSYRPAAGNAAIGTRVTGDTVSRFVVNADGGISWGPGGAGAVDTTLYRNAADVLKTDDKFVVAPTSATFPDVAMTATVPASSTADIINGNNGGSTLFRVDGSGNLIAANYTDGVWNAYTPTWGSSGTAPAIGNGTISGRYAKFGRTCMVQFELTFGTTTTMGTGNWTFSLPFTAVNPGGTSTNAAWCGAARGHDASAWYHGVVAVTKNSSLARIYSHSNINEWNLNQPTSWASASTNHMQATLTYETAS